MIARKFPTFSDEKNTKSGSIWVLMGRVGKGSEGLGGQDLELNTESRYSVFSRAESAVVPFAVTEVLEGSILQRRL